MAQACCCSFFGITCSGNCRYANDEENKDEEKNNSQVTMIAHNLTDVCGPRLTNSPGYNHCTRLGYTNPSSLGSAKCRPRSLGKFGRGWSTEGSYLAMKQPYYESIIAYPVAWTNGTKKTITADVILVDKLDSATINKLGKNIKGKIIMGKPTIQNCRALLNLSPHVMTLQRLTRSPMIIC